MSVPIQNWTSLSGFAKADAIRDLQGSGLHNRLVTQRSIG
jgi:hypothetical protein